MKLNVLSSLTHVNWGGGSTARVNIPYGFPSLNNKSGGGGGGATLAGDHQRRSHGSRGRQRPSEKLLETHISKCSRWKVIEFLRAFCFLDV